MRLSILEKFQSRVNKNGPLPHKRAKVRTRCHQWTGYIDDNGYGLFWVFGTHIGAHRFAWALKHGMKSIKDPDILVCHKCDNPGCVRYSHLFRGKHKDNSIDMFRKGRDRQARGAKHGRYTHPETSARGSAHGMSILTEKDVIAIRKQLVKGKTQTSLAYKYAVCSTTIRSIAIGKTWTHVTKHKH